MVVVVLIVVVMVVLRRFCALKEKRYRKKGFFVQKDQLIENIFSKPQSFLSDCAWILSIWLDTTEATLGQLLVEGAHKEE